MGRKEEPQAVGPQLQDLTILDPVRRPDGEVIDVVGAELAVNGFGHRRHLKELVQRPRLVSLEVGPRHPADLSRFDQPGHTGQRLLEQPSVPGVEQQRLLIDDEELVEGQPKPGHEGGDPIDPVGDFINLRHRILHSGVRPVAGRKLLLAEEVESFEGRIADLDLIPAALSKDEWAADQGSAAEGRVRGEPLTVRHRRDMVSVKSTKACHSSGRVRTLDKSRTTSAFPSRPITTGRRGNRPSPTAGCR